MKIKKLIACIMAVTMLLSLGIFSIGASASAPEGTPITTAAELAAIEKTGKYYLANDILITGEWVSPTGFSGTLDGNGKTVVFSGASVTGGLFNELAGATIKNLNLADGIGELHKENKWSTKKNSGANAFICAPLANLAFGTVENVKSSVNLGDLTIVNTIWVGGIIGAQYGGALTVKNCINTAPIQAGQYAGGIVGSMWSTSGDDLTIENCINYGDVYSAYTAAGIFGHSKGGFVKNLIIRNCANYGDISIKGGNQAGGIVGWFKLYSSDSSALIEKCVNYGVITGTEDVKGQYAGICTRINPNSSTKIEIKNNVNTVALSPAATATDAAIVSGIYATGGKTENVKCENNYTLECQTKTAPTKDVAGAAGATISNVDEAITALNNASANTFVKLSDDKIGLAWMQTAGLGEAAPTWTFTVDYTKVNEVVDDKDNEDEENDDDQEETETETETEAQAADTEEETTEKAKSGCGSSISTTGIIMLALFISISAFAAINTLKVDNKRK